jgi:hypothetical protein
MTIRIRKIRDGVYEVDIHAETPEGRKLPRNDFACRHCGSVL